MVLDTSGQQYAFLQVLTKAYLALMYSFQASTCVVDPQIFYNCSDPSSYASNPPTLPTTGDTSPIGGNSVTWYYTDYASYTFHGFTHTSFAAASQNLTTAATAMLLAGCASDDTCTSAYQAFNDTDDALAVVNALITTNINTIQSVLNTKPKNSWIPDTSYAYFTQMYTSVPGPSDEVYGWHSAVNFGIVNGTVNGSLYETVVQLGTVLYGGASMYESLMNHIIMGSFAYSVNKQSNINLTSPQVFRHIHDGTLDTRSTAPEPMENRTYETKWDIWLDESMGYRVPNKQLLYTSIKNQATIRTDSIFGLDFAASTKCAPPSNTQDGVSWLEEVANLCTANSFAKASTTATKELSAAVMAGVRAGLGNFASTAASVVAGQIINLCGGAFPTVHPCYASPTAWLRAGEVADVASLFAGIGLLIEGAPIAGGLAIAGATIGIGCDLANEAALHYQQGLACCKVSCTSSACQQSINGCAYTPPIC